MRVYVERPHGRVERENVAAPVEREPEERAGMRERPMEQVANEHDAADRVREDCATGVPEPVGPRP